MTPEVLVFNHVISLFTIAGQLFIAVLLIAFFGRKNKACKKILDFIAEKSFLLAGIVAAASTLGSLYYSEIAGFTPCELCWYQRIFMYPQAIILLIAAWYQEKNLAKYSLSLSAIGALIAAYHYYGQMFNSSVLPCEVVGLTPSCSERFFVEFGYITIPMMALTAFAMILAIFLIGTVQKRDD